MNQLFKPYLAIIAEWWRIWVNTGYLDRNPLFFRSADYPPFAGCEVFIGPCPKYIENRGVALS